MVPGSGKTFAAQLAVGEFAVAQAWVQFPSRPTMLHVARRPHRELTRADPGRANRFDLSEELIALLAGREWLLVVIEAQWLNRECIEYLRHLHDHPRTRFSLLLVGGDPLLSNLSPARRRSADRTLSDRPGDPPGRPIRAPAYDRADCAMSDRYDDLPGRPGRGPAYDLDRHRTADDERRRGATHQRQRAVHGAAACVRPGWTLNEPSAPCDVWKRASRTPARS